MNSNLKTSGSRIIEYRLRINLIVSAHFSEALTKPCRVQRPPAGYPRLIAALTRSLPTMYTRQWILGAPVAAVAAARLPISPTPATNEISAPQSTNHVLPTANASASSPWSNEAIFTLIGVIVTVLGIFITLLFSSSKLRTWLAYPFQCESSSER
jgi:hypothetical protein